MAENAKHDGAHEYRASINWTGAASGFDDYETYDRTHQISIDGKPTLTTSSDPAFLGQQELWNPEDMMIAAISSCHMLSYLACCARARITVESYTDDAWARMLEDGKGGGYFSEAVIRPRVVIAEADKVAHATRLHNTAHKVCFIANSVNFPIRCEPEIIVAD